MGARVSWWERRTRRRPRSGVLVGLMVIVLWIFPEGRGVTVRALADRGRPAVTIGESASSRAVERRIGVSEGGGARNEREKQRLELEAAGWELVERGGGKTIWRNPQSGGLYPQSVAITMVREGPSPRLTGEAPGEGGGVG